MTRTTVLQIITVLRVATQVTPTCLTYTNTTPQPLTQPYTKSGRKILLRRATWESHKVVSDIVRILLEEALGFEVEAVLPLATAHSVLEEISRGALHIDPEWWTTAGIGKLQENAGRVKHHSHSVRARSGWYVPAQIIENNRESVGLPMQYATHLVDPTRLQTVWKDQDHLLAGTLGGDPSGICDSLQAFGCNGTRIHRTPTCDSNHFAGSQCAVQLLKGPITYDQGIVEQQAANLGVNMSIVYMEEKGVEQQLWHSLTQAKPVLLYHYEPSALVSRYPLLRLGMLPNSKNCFPRATNNTPDGQVSCDFPSVNLMSIFWNDLEDEAIDAYSFFANFRLNQADYDFFYTQLLANELWDEQKYHMTACDWVREHKNVWKQWAISTVVPEHGCLLALVVQTFLFLFFCKLAFFGFYCCGDKMAIDKTHLKSKMIKAISSLDDSSDVPGAVRSSISKKVTQKTRRCLFFRAIGHFLHRDVKVRDAVYGGMEAIDFLKCNHSEEFFMKDSTELGDDSRHGDFAVLPSGLREQLGMERKKMYAYLLTRSLGRALHRSIAFCLLAGIWATLLDWLEREKVYEMGEENKANVLRLMADYKWLPVLLLGFYVNREVGRWLEYVRLSLCVMGRLMDCSLYVAAAFPPPIRPRGRAAMYKFYRYLQVMHFLCYIKLDRRLPTDPTEATQLLVSAKLLTNDEAKKLAARDPRMTETSCAWLIALFSEEVHAGNIPEIHLNQWLDMVTRLRAFSNSIKDIPCYHEPNSMNALLGVLVDVLLLLLLLAYPLQFRMKEQPYHCVEPYAMLSTLFAYFIYGGLMEMIRILHKGPFSANSDIINADVLVTRLSTVSWFLIRSGFDQAVPRRPLGDQIPSWQEVGETDVSVMLSKISM